MIVIDNTIKYIALGILLYFFIKALFGKKLNTSQTVVIVASLLILIYFIYCHNYGCKYKSNFDNQV